MKEYRIVTKTPSGGQVVTETALLALYGDVAFEPQDCRGRIMSRRNSKKYETYPDGSVWIEEREVGPWSRME